ncbi:hypothetical protein ACNOYE_02375 [Nannocystaceae bacterium ST9]
MIRAFDPRLAFAFMLGLSGCTGGGSDDATTTDESESDADTTTTTTGESESSETAVDEVGTDDVPDCTPGAFGCTCAEGDTCAPDLACKEGMCTFSDCSTGYEGCACGQGDVCNEGLFCVEGICGCEPGSVGCGCTESTVCEGEMSCIGGECWLPSPYPNCGWLAAQKYYFCGNSMIAHPDFPLECPADLVVDMPCPAELTFEGCCDDTGTWWCQGGVIAFMAC